MAAEHTVHITSLAATTVASSTTVAASTVASSTRVASSTAMTATSAALFARARSRSLLRQRQASASSSSTSDADQLRSIQDAEAQLDRLRQERLDELEAMTAASAARAASFAARAQTLAVRLSNAEYTIRHCGEPEPEVSPRLRPTWEQRDEPETEVIFDDLDNLIE